MTTPESCPHCGAPMPAGPALEGLCPACLLRGTLEPARIPGLEIHSKLGAGGMGIVYKARQVDLDRVVAVKVLTPVHAADPEFVRRFLREAHAAAKITDPHVVAVYDVGTAESGCYIVMEYVEGRSLDHILKEGRPPIARAASLMEQALRALAAAHAEGVLHRDIKPANLMVDTHGRVKLADFGLARPIEAGPSATRLQGTPRYISPEQARGDPLDARSDLYSLGAVFYEVLAGRPPFTDDTPNALLLAHASPEAAPPLLRRLVPDVPPDLTRVVHKMLAKNRDLRHASAQAALADLKRGAADRRLPASPARRPTWILPTAIAAGVVALALAVLPLLKAEPPPEPPPPVSSKKPPAPPEEALALARDKLVAHWSGDQRMADEDFQGCLSLLRRYPESAAARSADEAMDRFASRVVEAADQAIESGDFDRAERLAWTSDFPVERWIARFNDVFRRISERPLPPVPPPVIEQPTPEPEPEPARATVDLVPVGFVVADGLFASDDRSVLLLDRDAAELVRFSLESREETARVRLPREPVRLVKRDSLLFVACREAGVIAIVDEATLEVRGRVHLPNGRPCAVVAPRRDPDRIYAADGESLFAIDVGARRVAKTVGHQRRTLPPSFEPNRTVYLSANPDASRLYLHGGWSTRFDRTLTALEGSGSGLDVFDGGGQFLFTYDGKIMDADRQTVFATARPRMIWGSRPSMPWVVGADLPTGRVVYYDVGRHAVPGGEDFARFIMFRSSSDGPLPFSLSIRHDRTGAAIIPHAWLGDWARSELKDQLSRLALFALPPEAAEREHVAVTSIPPKEAPIGYRMEYVVQTEPAVSGPLEATIADGPEGMQYDADTRLLTWTPHLSQRGEHPVRLILKTGDPPAEVRWRLSADLRRIRWSPGAFDRFEIASDGRAVFAWGHDPVMDIYDLATDTRRTIETEPHVEIACSVGATLYYVSTGDLWSVALDSVAKPRKSWMIPADLGLWPFLETAGGNLPLIILARGRESNKSYYRLTPGSGVSPMLPPTPEFSSWKIDPSGAVIYGINQRILQAIDISGTKAKGLWERILPTERAEIHLTSDGKRLCVGGELISAADGSVLGRVEGHQLIPDPSGAYITSWKDGIVHFFKDETLEPLSTLALSGLMLDRAIYVHQYGRLVLIQKRRTVYIVPFEGGPR